MRATKKLVLLTSTALAASVAATAALAGSFALREQSAYYQGMSFAGSGTSGGTISAMYWNPAALTGAKDGATLELHNSFIIPKSDIDGTFNPGALTQALGATSNSKSSGDIAQDAWLPATYASYRVNEDLVFGLAINTPFGLTTKPEDDWAGQYYNRSSRVFSINLNPSVAYDVNDKLTIGLGAQVQYFKVNLKSAYAFSQTAQSSVLKGDGVGIGATAGLTFKPVKGTEIGLGFRSATAVDLEGDFDHPAGFNPLGAGAFGASSAGIKGTFVTPEMVTLSVSQKVGEKLRLAGTVEWTNWSRLDQVALFADGSSATNNPTGLPTLKFEYEDGWFFAAGGEYDWNEKLTLRTGLAYEISPIDDKNRTARIPDANRWWLSAGATYNYNEKLAFDVGYTHIIPECADINITDGHHDYNSNVGTFTGKSDANVNILSASMRYTF